MRQKRFKKLEEFIDILIKSEEENKFDTPGISSQFAFDCLTEALLGPDYYMVLPCSNKQGNTEILDAILRIYSKDYRRLIERKQKELKNGN